MSAGSTGRTWRWLQKPGELEELRTIVGEVERAMLCGETGDQRDYTTLHGRWAFWAQESAEDPVWSWSDIVAELKTRVGLS
jgi:hypothetical protein